MDGAITCVVYMYMYPPPSSKFLYMYIPGQTPRDASLDLGLSSGQSTTCTRASQIFQLSIELYIMMMYTIIYIHIYDIYTCNNYSVAKDYLVHPCRCNDNQFHQTTETSLITKERENQKKRNEGEKLEVQVLACLQKTTIRLVHVKC